MRQHPIPQNVLDVEFKLFTKFTLKEFAYLAVGLSVGGIFLYLTVRGDIPGIIGIPAFIIFGGAGTFLATVPINDQNADTFIMNYFTAINRPTQRVWLNRTMKEDRIKPQIESTKKEDGKNSSGNAQVIGGSKIPESQKLQVFVENPGDDILETLVQETEQTTEQQQMTTAQTVETVTPVVTNDELLTITEDNVSSYQFSIKSIDKLPGNINIWLCTKENQPLPNVNTYLKDSSGKILYANKTGPNGYFLTSKVYEPGVYILEFENIAASNLQLRLVLSANMSKLPLKIQLI